MKDIKKLIYRELIIRQNEKIKNLQLLIKSTIDSRNSDTKSSAGDKHETSRAKIQTEIDHYSKQLSISLNQLHQLDSIDISLKNNKAVFGSLVVTNKATFFISIGLGKINIKSNDFFIISLDSPIGMIIKNKTINKSFQLRGVDYKIKNIE